MTGNCEHGRDNSGSINETFLTSREAAGFEITILIQGFVQSVCYVWFLRALVKVLFRVLTYVGCGPGELSR